MDIIFLVKIFFGLVVVLFVLLFFLVYVPNKRKEAAEKKAKKQPKKEVRKREEPESLEKLVAVLKNKSSKSEELKEALDKIIKFHGTIPPKNGVRLSPRFNIYGEILMRICRHPNTTKDIIISFDRELEKKNPAYVKEINDFLTKGLNTRGF